MCCNLSLFTVTGWNTAGMLCAVISLYLLLLVGTLLVCYVLYSLFIYCGWLEHYWYVMCCNLSLFTVTGWNTAGMLYAVISLYLL